MMSDSEDIGTKVIDAEDVSAQAQQAHLEGRVEVAIELYQVALATRQAGAGSLRDAINLGALLRSSGLRHDAIEHYRHWLAVLPPSKTLALNACNCFREEGLADEAIQAVNDAIRESDYSNDLIIARAECLLDMHLAEEAKELLEIVLQNDKEKSKAWVALGLTLAKMQRFEEAIAAFKKARRLSSDDCALAANILSLLTDSGNCAEAENTIRTLSKKEVDSPSVLAAIGGLRLRQNNSVEASQLFALACQKAPSVGSHWLNWAASLRSLKYTVAPMRIINTGLRHNPEDSNLLEAYAQILAEMSYIECAERAWSIRNLAGNAATREVNVFNRQFLGTSTGILRTEILKQEAQEWEKVERKNGTGPLWQDSLMSAPSERRLRVGYLTSDACNHPVGRFLLPILKNHNKEKIETWLLSGAHNEDWITLQLKRAADHWIDVSRLDNRVGARLVSDLSLDVIVELGGFTGGSRIGVLIHRPAPVQLSYLGYPGPTYLECIDGWIGDEEIFAGLDEASKNTHKLLKVAGGYMAFDPGEGIDLPERHPSEHIRFGCFNHARKLSKESIELFVEVLNRHENAQLVLKSISFHEEAERDRIRSRFEMAGLARERLVILKWVKGGLNHLMKYSYIDIALDTIPYGGATTTCEALWMGVPVVTLAGSGMIGRLGTSILRSAGCEHWIADSRCAYIDIAHELASHGKRNLASRSALREKIKTSKLADPIRLAQALEERYAAERGKVRDI